MELTTTTPIAVFAAVLLIWLGPVWGLPVLFSVLPLGAAAAFNLPALGDSSIIVADIVTCVFIAIVMASPGQLDAILEKCRAGTPGFFLVATLALGFIITAFSPRLFAGATDVFSIGRVAGEVGVVIRPLGPSSGNVTQSFRLSLGVLAFLTSAAILKAGRDDRLVVLAFVSATMVNLALAIYDYATWATDTPQLMAWLRTANYSILDHHEIAGVKRIIGDFPEASAFGYYSLGLFGFWYSYWLSGGQMSKAWLMACRCGGYGPAIRIVSRLWCIWSVSSRQFRHGAGHDRSAPDSATRCGGGRCIDDIVAFCGRDRMDPAPVVERLFGILRPRTAFETGQRFGD